MQLDIDMTEASIIERALELTSILDNNLDVIDQLHSGMANLLSDFLNPLAGRQVDQLLSKVRSQRKEVNMQTEMAECSNCGEEFPVEQLNDDGLCPDCEQALDEE